MHKKQKNVPPLFFDLAFDRHPFSLPTWFFIVLALYLFVGSKRGSGIKECSVVVQNTVEGRKAVTLEMNYAKTYCGDQVFNYT